MAKQDKATAGRIVNKLRDLAHSDAPEAMCKPLGGTLAGLHRLRVGDWRVIVDFHHGTCTVFALEIGHRKNIYNQ